MEELAATINEISNVEKMHRKCKAASDMADNVREQAGKADPSVCRDGLSATANINKPVRLERDHQDRQEMCIPD